MTKNEAIKAAKEKADQSKRNQVVFSYTAGDDPAGWTCLAYDYTHESLWTRRQHRVPIVTKVTVVTPDTLGLRK